MLINMYSDAKFYFLKTQGPQSSNWRNAAQN